MVLCGQLRTWKIHHICREFTPGICHSPDVIHSSFLMKSPNLKHVTDSFLQGLENGSTTCYTVVSSYFMITMILICDIISSCKYVADKKLTTACFFRYFTCTKRIPVGSFETQGWKLPLLFFPLSLLSPVLEMIDIIFSLE